MRAILWPDDHDLETNAYFTSASTVAAAVFVADRGGRRLGGFIEIGERSYAEGCETSPVAYVEGWFVDPDLRRKGVGSELIRAGEAWARARGYVEIGSDVLIDNAVSVAAHTALGYREIERVACFAKRLPNHHQPK